jgi:hypothetical protein
MRLGGKGGGRAALLARAVVRNTITRLNLGRNRRVVDQACENGGGYRERACLSVRTAGHHRAVRALAFDAGEHRTRAGGFRAGHHAVMLAVSATAFWGHGSGGRQQER